MLKQSVLLTKPYYLSFKQKQLYINSKLDVDSVHIPVEDIGLLLIDNAEITLSTTLIAQLMEHNCAVVFCNEKHIPIGLSLTLDGNHIHNAITTKQIAMGTVKKKQLWKLIITQKIANQGMLLQRLGLNYKEVLKLSRQVSSGDGGNVEGAAARKYWQTLFSDIKNFRRDRYGEYPNNFLNYGYAILRAATARALIGSGLALVLGIHHHNKYNAYCLVDDIIEAYRPFIDFCVYELVHAHPDKKELDSKLKMELVHALYQDTLIKRSTHPLLNALSFTSASFVRCLEEGAEQLVLPKWNTKH